jgi:hypothetical protein
MRSSAMSCARPIQKHSSRGNDSSSLDFNSAHFPGESPGDSDPRNFLDGWRGEAAYTPVLKGEGRWATADLLSTPM